MIVGFSKYSKGPGSGPVDYLTRAKNPNGTFRTPPPVVLEGDAERVRSQDQNVRVDQLYWSQARSGCCPQKKLLTASTRT
jgi:hypothetical protein